MANRRNLKKAIGSLAGELFMEVLIYKWYVPGVDQDKVNTLMARILDMQDQYIARCSYCNGKEDKQLTKSYFKGLRSDLQTEINAIVSEIEGLSKQ